MGNQEARRDLSEKLPRVISVSHILSKQSPFHTEVIEHYGLLQVIYLPAKLSVRSWSRLPRTWL
jgi:hypothetical protein